MAYKMKNGTGPNALPLLALIPPAIVAGKAIAGATGVVATKAAAGAIGAAATKATLTGLGAAGAKATVGTVGAVTGKVGLGGKIVAGATKAVKGVKGAVKAVKGTVKAVKSAVESTKAVKGVEGVVEGTKLAKGSKLGDALGKVVEKKVLGSTVKEHATSALKSKIMQAPAKAQQEIEERQDLKQQKQELFKSKFSPSMMGDKKGPNMEKTNKEKGPNMEKSRKRIAQDYARNAIVDGNTKEGRYEKKMAVKEAAGESPSMMGHNPISKHMGGRGASMYGEPMMMGKKPMMMGKKPMMMGKKPMMMGGENVIVRDAKSGGKNQYDKYGK